MIQDRQTEKLDALKAQATQDYVRVQVEKRKWGKSGKRVWLYVLTFLLDSHTMNRHGLQQGDGVVIRWEDATFRKAGESPNERVNLITWRSHGCGKVQVLHKDKPSKFHQKPGDLARYFTLKVSPDGTFYPDEEMQAPPSARWERRRFKTNQQGQQIRKIKGAAAEALEEREIRRKGSARAKYYKPAGGYRG